MSWALVNTGGIGATGTGGNLSFSPGWTANVGDVIVVAVVSFDVYLTGGVSDGVNTWHQAGKMSSVAAFTELWYTVVTAGGSLTITATGQAFSAMSVAELSSGGTNALDHTAVTNSGNSNALSTGNVAGTAGDLWVGGFGVGSAGGGTISASGAFTLGYVNQYVPSNHLGIALNYLLNGSSTPQNAAVSMVTGEPWAAIGAAFIASAPSVISNGQTLLASL